MRSITFRAAGILPETPLGPLRLLVSDQGLARVEFCTTADLDGEEASSSFSSAPLLLAAMEQLRDYFDGRRQSFSMPLEWQGMTPFQERVLRATLEIPYGQTRTYGQLAADLGNAGASRAVGVALGKNPLPIVIPCHRVLGSHGRMQGYSAPDGFAKKSWLLKLEGVLLLG
jgi:methylated-DNA-[protein]-cysteine S-methyltransferase